MSIYLDVGNSRIKWRLDVSSHTHIAASIDELAQQWQDLGDIASCELFACNVRGEAIAVQISVLAQRCFSSPVVWLITTAECCGVVNGYHDPHRLGVDRWAALVGARARIHDTACIVIDAGTAITVDVLDASGRHRGGVIMPGARTMLGSLDQAAQLFPDVDENLQSFALQEQALTNSTRDALLAGVIFAVRGGVQAVIAQQAKQINVKIEALFIILTGGDSSMLKLDSMQTSLAPDLVLEGLERLARGAQ